MVSEVPGSPSADELERLAEAAFWSGRPRETIAAWQRAYARHRDAGDERRAALAAVQLFHHHYDLDETAVASGWVLRARRHAAHLEPDGAEAGHVALAEAVWCLYRGQVEDALEHGERAVGLARRHGDRDLEALTLATQGRMRVAAHDVAGALDCMDEAMVAVLGDELSPFATGLVYCIVLSTCHDVGDVGRASEWTAAAVRWSAERGRASWYPGLCRLHQCELRSLRGEWADAEREAQGVAQELAPFGDYLLAEVAYLTGEIRRRRGDDDGAAEAFRRAHELGLDPQPGLALLRLAQGEVRAAVAALRLAALGAPGGPLHHARLLSAQVEAELAVGDVDGAAHAVDRLEDLAASTRSRLVDALALLARGTVLLASDDAARALRHARDACRALHELVCPYEQAQARVLAGSAARRLGDADTSRLELESARACFARLGAAPDVERVDVLLAGPREKPGGLTARELEVLSLVARGASNRQIASALFISEHTVARHLSNIFVKLGVASRSAAAAFAFERGLA
jgi:DNA-binding NarL/FixJ family response regulator